MSREPAEGVGYSGPEREAPAGHESVRSHPLIRPPGVVDHDPDNCPHTSFAVRADVNRLTDVDGPGGKVIGYDLEIAVDCTACMTAFEFVGLPMGLSPRHPTGSFDGTILTAPVRPFGSPPDWGFDRIGFGVQVWTRDEQPGETTERAR